MYMHPVTSISNINRLRGIMCVCMKLMMCVCEKHGVTYIVTLRHIIMSIFNPGLSVTKRISKLLCIRIVLVLLKRNIFHSFVAHELASRALAKRVNAK